MTIDEAIEILGIDVKFLTRHGSDVPQAEAEQLGIEALETIIAVRQDTEKTHSIHYMLEKLPSETEEGK